jgi:hypothetical protein
MTTPTRARPPDKQNRSARANKPFDSTFETLRGVLSQFAGELLVQVDKPGEYQLSSRTLKDRIGRPLFVAAVQTKKNYVSYHLMPIYTLPDLMKDLSPSLRKRMQGKSCFNFTTIDDDHVRELTGLTREGIKRVESVKLPWNRT